MLRLNLFKKVFNMAKTTDAYNKGCELVKKYYELCDGYQIKYGKVGDNYLDYDRRPKCDRVEGCQVHHTEQIWYTESINPKCPTTNFYGKTNVDNATITRERKKYRDYVMSKYSHLQGSHLLCYCTPEEHRELHDIIKEFQEVVGLKK